MYNEKEYLKRKATRLKSYDYSSTGVYFVTICIQDRKQILSKIIRTSRPVTDESENSTVGEGLAPPEYSVRLKPCGEIAREQLLQIEKRFPNVSVKDYVIMPDHIHATLYLRKETGGASPSPTLDDVICAFKSLTSRVCKQRYGIDRMFQRSFAEHIIRDREDYETRKKYIFENPTRWYYKNLNAGK